MNPNSIKPVKNKDFYIKTAIQKADKGIIEDDYKSLHLKKISSMRNYIVDTLDKIFNDFPSIDSLPEFYNKLIHITIDTDQFRKSLARIQGSKNQINKLYQEYNRKIKNSQSKKEILRFKKEFMGRLNSSLYNEPLDFLEETRKKMRSFPIIKENIYTVALCGFPNIGKSTLLNKLTTAKAEINSYAFTTKKLNIGYLKENYYVCQIIDTPGTLNRFEKMNWIEKQAYLALKHVADTIVYIFDLTEAFPVEMQLELYKAIKSEYKDVYVYFSKNDIISKSRINSFIKEHKIPETKTFTTAADLKKFILKKTFERRSML